MAVIASHYKRSNSMYGKLVLTKREINPYEMRLRRRTIKQ